MKKYSLFRFLSLAVAVFCFLSSVIGVTYAWQSGAQTVRNEFQGEADKHFVVELQKRMKSPNGVETETPLPGAAFYLFEVTERDGETAERQIGMRYLTGKEGNITLSLPKGRYCFFEEAPPAGYAYDRDEAGNEIRRYPFEVTGDGTETVRVVAYNVPVYGALAVTKTVRNITGTPLTDEQKAAEYHLRITFSDGGAYAYLQNGEIYSLQSGGMLTLRHGETALFERIPDGVTYTVTECDLSGMIPAVITRSGVIAEGATAGADFTNYAPGSENDLTLRITKRVEGDAPDSERERAFGFILTVNGEERIFTLKDGETSPDIVVPYGAVYTLQEADYTKDGYRSDVTAVGTVTNDQTLIEAEAVNTYVRQTVEISGEKTWELAGYDAELPESITVVLKNGSLNVMKATVKPDETGVWRYTFTAPRFDDEGAEIAYSVEETPIEHYRAVYAGYDVKNVYVPPVTAAMPAVTKLVDGEGAPKDAEFEFLLRGENGAPMPENSADGVFTLIQKGAGEAKLPPITFDKAGTYTYSVSELDRGESGWIYDAARYTLTVTVTAADDGLKADIMMEKDGKDTDALVFLNQFRSGATEATEGTTPTDSTEPTEEIQPTAATEATEPTAATEPTEGTTPTDSTVPTDATEATAPTDSTAPAEETQPTAATEAAVPTATTAGGSSQNGGGTSQNSGNAKTGDTRTIWPWLALMGLSLTVIGVHTLLFIRQKRRQAYFGKYFKKM